MPNTEYFDKLMVIRINNTYSLTQEVLLNTIKTISLKGNRMFENYIKLNAVNIIDKNYTAEFGKCSENELIKTLSESINEFIELISRYCAISKIDSKAYFKKKYWPDVQQKTITLIFAIQDKNKHLDYLFHLEYRRDLIQNHALEEIIEEVCALSKTGGIIEANGNVMKIPKLDGESVGVIMP